ncbi:hypothetical protein [Tichowtungia aerotolerans]|uniref:Uncharacterized protein n=1 Tax=Tichowtungia aerotolerans TaxID=2697043 RepID=A0A6P1M8N9_9BACT|nr:hypothetical protein [Tichowtungia aerotolerans]QHI70251.1 hypothetical protein GT409_12630 [Tichowtungia aerotolerans]
MKRCKYCSKKRVADDVCGFCNLPQSVKYRNLPKDEKKKASNYRNIGVLGLLLFLLGSMVLLDHFSRYMAVNHIENVDVPSPFETFRYIVYFSAGIFMGLRARGGYLLGLIASVFLIQRGIPTYNLTAILFGFAVLLLVAPHVKEMVVRPGKE